MTEHYPVAGQGLSPDQHGIIARSPSYLYHIFISLNDDYRQGKSRPRPSFIPPTCFIIDFAHPPIFRLRAAIPQLDKQRGSIFLRPGSSMLLPKLLWVLSGPHHSDPYQGIREFTGPFPQISLCSSSVVKWLSILSHCDSNGASFSRTTGEPANQSRIALFL